MPVSASSNHMRYLALASDYDDTLAQQGRVDEDTLRALERLRQSGRKFILVTGRELPNLQQVFPAFGLCEAIVAENGALLYTRGAHQTTLLAPAPPAAFLKDLERRGIEVSAGEAIVATSHLQASAVLESIDVLGLDLQLIFNKNWVMVLPSGVNKMTGLRRILAELGISPHNVVAIGDAENDLPFLEGCGCAVAVENALAVLKEQADWITKGARGAGVTELIDRLLTDDLSSIAAHA